MMASWTAQISQPFKEVMPWDRQEFEKPMTQDQIQDLVPDAIVSGLNFPEPIEVLVVKPMGAMTKVIGRGTQTGQSHQLILSAAQIVERR